MLGISVPACALEVIVPSLDESIMSTQGNHKRFTINVRVSRPVFANCRIVCMACMCHARSRLLQTPTFIGKPM